MRSRNAPLAATGFEPSTRTSPASARRWPSRISTRVVLPAPFGPEHRDYLAAADVRSRPSSACAPPVIRLAHAADLDGGLRGARGCRRSRRLRASSCHVAQCRTRRRSVIGGGVEPGSPPVGGARRARFHPSGDDAHAARALRFSAWSSRSCVRGEPPVRVSSGRLAMTVIVFVVAVRRPAARPARQRAAGGARGRRARRRILLSVPRADMPAWRRVDGLALVAAGTWR